MSYLSNITGIDIDSTTGQASATPGGTIGALLLGGGNPFQIAAGAAAGNSIIPQTPNPPNLQSPDALSSQPTLAQSTTTALQNQLANEKVAASTSSILTGGAGLLDEPTTTSRVLMGY